jgi:hypothetical protein
MLMRQIKSDLIESISILNNDSKVNNNNYKNIVSENENVIKSN